MSRVGETGSDVRYSEAFKKRIVEKALRSGETGQERVAHEARIKDETLSRWVAEAREVAGMSKEETKARVASRVRTAGEKLRLVLRSEGLEEQALGEFLRREGVHAAELERWRKDAISGLERASGGQSAEARELAAVKKELARKEAALGEAAALLMLQKKLQRLLAVEDESTQRESGR